jgi:hypothetical protein
LVLGDVLIILPQTRLIESETTCEPQVPIYLRAGARKALGNDRRSEAVQPETGRPARACERASAATVLAKLRQFKQRGEQFVGSPAQPIRRRTGAFSVREQLADSSDRQRQDAR